MSPWDILFILGFSLTWIGILIVMAAFTLGSLTKLRKVGEGIGGKEEGRVEGKGEEKGEEKGERKIEWGGVIFIGPFPIVFGSNRRFVKALAIVAAVLALIILGFTILMLT
ncbi:DUF131 domain-containing protein [Candidatus Bathyarchaeota archaeon]|nr:DUF131 domain-containing protein [Candidatus Bathyarchaeota archaeon]MBS7627786.1 DUF131 domain-containing protein [Candidatus Bathyarchaeota archaeon]